MAASTFFIPSVNVIGADSLNDAMNMGDAANLLI